MTWRKRAAALGSALPDPVKSEAAVSPAAPVAVENKTAPGQTGPRGMAPRTTYSRVNTGGSPTPQVGGEQKATPPRGMEFLPQKVAHRRISMGSMMTRPLLQDLVKQAMEATVSKVSIVDEAARQLGQPQEKTAAAAPPSNHIPSEVCEKYAEALEYMAKQADIQLSGGTTSGTGPGEGPNSMGVLEAQSEDPPIQPGAQGQATSKNVPPKDPPMRSFPDSNGPANVMDDNLEMQHPEQPVDPMNNETASNAGLKESSALFRKNAAALGIKKVAAGQPMTADEADEAMSDASPNMLRGVGIGSTLGTLGGITGGMALADKLAPRSGLAIPAGLAAGGLVGGLGGGILGGALGHRFDDPEKVRAAEEAYDQAAAAQQQVPKQASAASVGRRAKELLTGSKARHLAKQLKIGDKAGGLPSAIRKPMVRAARAERVKSFGTQAGALGAVGGSGYAAAKAGKKEKKASAEDVLLRNLQVLGLSKQAEDAINPAQISAGAASAQGAEAPQGVSASEEGPVPSEPSDVNSQKRLIATNDAAINYTKRQAKADPKRDLGQLITEPALSASTDKTLDMAFDNTNAAGAKIAAARLTKTAAAHALLLKLAEEACSDKKVKKEKNSVAQMGVTPMPAQPPPPLGQAGQGRHM